MFDVMAVLAGKCEGRDMRARGRRNGAVVHHCRQVQKAANTVSHTATAQERRRQPRLERTAWSKQVGAECVARRSVLAADDRSPARPPILEWSNQLSTEDK